MASFIRGRYTRLFEIGKSLGATKRWKSGCGYKMPKEECAKEESHCKKYVIKTQACEANKPKAPPPPPKAKKEPFKSVWGPECTPGPCPNPPPKFDALHYKRTDKLTRCYQQTWNECPPRLVVQKKICEYPKFKMPPLEKRPRRLPATAKPAVSCQAKSYMQCDRKALKQNKKCLKLTAPGCRAVRSPPKCKINRGPANCKKAKCPYPSFSECKRPSSNRKRPNECECLGVRSICQVYTILRSKGIPV